MYVLDRLVKHALQIPLRQGRALEVLDGLDVLGDPDRLLVLYGLHLALAQLLLDLGVVAEVELCADQDDGDAGRVVLDFGVPLLAGGLAGFTYSFRILSHKHASSPHAVISTSSSSGYPYLGLNVVKTRRRNDTEADQENVRLGVAERAQAIVVLLTGGIPETQADGLVVDHDAGGVVVEDGGDVLAGESVGGVGDEQAGLADGTVAGDDAFERLRGGGGHCCGWWWCGAEGGRGVPWRDWGGREGGRAAVCGAILCDKVAGTREWTVEKPPGLFGMRSTRYGVGRFPCSCTTGPQTGEVRQRGTCFRASISKAERAPRSKGSVARLVPERVQEENDRGVTR